MKKTIYLFLAVIMTACLFLFGACGSVKPDNKNGGGDTNGGGNSGGNSNEIVDGNLIDDNIFKEACVDEFGHSAVVKGDNGITFSADDGKGGYCVQWSEQFDFNDFSMSFTLNAEKIVNNRKWFGFAFSSSNEKWYDRVSSVLVYFRLDFESDGTPKPSATVNVIAQKSILFPGENPDLEVQVPVNLNGENTFTLSYMDLIEDWVMSFNEVDIVVKPSSSTTADTTANFSKVYQDMPDGKMYLHVASDRLKDDGNTSFTVTKVNGRNATEYLA